jgi:hypothetical protein
MRDKFIKLDDGVSDAGLIGHALQSACPREFEAFREILETGRPEFMSGFSTISGRAWAEPAFTENVATMLRGAAVTFVLTERAKRRNSQS